MHLEVLKDKDMDLLSRRRVTLLISTESSTPSRHSLIKEIAQKFKTKEELVVIRHIYPQYGKRKVKVIVHIYQDKDKMSLFEHKSLIKKHTPEQPKKEETAKEEPKHEKIQEG